MSPPASVGLPEVSIQQCEDELNGLVVGDNGNGAICETNGEPPIGVIVRAEGEPIAIEFESVLSRAYLKEGDLAADRDKTAPADFPSETTGEPDEIPPGTTVEFLDMEVTRQECLEQGGQIVGDIGDGVIFEPDYVCESNGQPPVAIVVPAPGEPIANEGEVCCGSPELMLEKETSSSGGISIIGVVRLVVLAFEPFPGVLSLCSLRVIYIRM